MQRKYSNVLMKHIPFYQARLKNQNMIVKCHQEVAVVAVDMVVIIHRTGDIGKKKCVIPLYKFFLRSMCDCFTVLSNTENHLIVHTLWSV